MLIGEFRLEPTASLLFDFLDLADGAAQLYLNRPRHRLRHSVETRPVLISERQVEQQVSARPDAQILHEGLCPFRSDSLEEFDGG